MNNIAIQQSELELDLVITDEMIAEDSPELDLLITDEMINAASPEHDLETTDQAAYTIIPHTEGLLTNNRPKPVIQAPINAVTGHLYRGHNVQRLLETNSPTMLFATVCQWSSVGRKVIKGQKAIARIVLGFDRDENPTEDEEEDDQSKNKRKSHGWPRIAKPVFAWEQTEPIPEGWAPKRGKRQTANKETVSN
jgi:hypothetical protein